MDSTSFLFKQLEKVKDSIAEVWRRNRTFRFVIRVLILGAAFAAGFYSHAELSGLIGLTALERVAVVATAIVTLATALVLVTTKFLKLELLSRDLKLKSLDIESTDSIRNEAAASIADDLVSRVNRAIDAKSSLPGSVFSERSTHYEEEKRFLAEYFIKTLLPERIDHLRKEGRRIGHVRILFDSGTTISPMLDLVGRQAKEGDLTWNDRVQIATNNLKGIEKMLGYRSGDGRYANLSIENLYVLPGKILAPYEAIADPDTLAAVDRFGLKNDGIYTIFVTTGNYILLSKYHFLPIARAGYHPDFKARAYEVADEVYVIAPLGKVLSWAEADPPPPASLHDMLERFNGDLGLEDMLRGVESETKSYQLVYKALSDRKSETSGNEEPVAKVTVEEEKKNVKNWLAKTTLVTTTRPPSCFFSAHSNFVNSRFFRNRSYRAEWKADEGPFVWNKVFDELPWSLSAQRLQEIPHENMREVERRNRYFAFEQPN